MKPKPKTPDKILNNEEFEEQLLLKDRALASAAEGITISDPSLPDNPLIYVNEGFTRLTGYPVDEVIGRNCRFLQGHDTDPSTVGEIREAIRDDRACTVEILNYRKDGTPFWNRLSITPVRDASGKVINHIGIQSDVTARRNAEEALREAKQKLEEANSRMRRDLEAAARIQQALLPQQKPEAPGLELAWAFRPCDELAGDLLNVFPIAPDIVAMYILDVSGHGVAASLLSVAVSRMLTPVPGRSVVYRDAAGTTTATPAEVAQKLNEYFPFDARTAQYFTLVYGLLHVKSSTFRYIRSVWCQPQPTKKGRSSLPKGIASSSIPTVSSKLRTPVKLNSGPNVFLEVSTPPVNFRSRTASSR